VIIDMSGALIILAIINIIEAQALRKRQGTQN
jgi:hypothetical protein